MDVGIKLGRYDMLNAEIAMVFLTSLRTHESILLPCLLHYVIREVRLSRRRGQDLLASPWNGETTSNVEAFAEVTQSNGVVII
jgi:hypothetical protein